jgi:hypothetical protein
MTPEYEQYSKRDKHSPEVDWSRFQAIIWKLDKSIQFSNGLNCHYLYTTWKPDKILYGLEAKMTSIPIPNYFVPI